MTLKNSNPYLIKEDKGEGSGERGRRQGTTSPPPLRRRSGPRLLLTSPSYTTSSSTSSQPRPQALNFDPRLLLATTTPSSLIMMKGFASPKQTLISRIELLPNSQSCNSNSYAFTFHQSHIMLRIKTPKTLRARRELEKHAPKLVENAKKTLILHGTKTSNVLNEVLTEIYHLKKDNAVKYTKRNDNIRPFESGGETSLEFFSLKSDCSLFVFGSHSKKRPDNLVIGRTYDHHIYDLVEVGVENFKSMASCSYDKKLAPLIGSKPFFAFIGEGFENVDELKHLKEILLDLFRGQVVSNLNLAGLDRVYICTAVSANKVNFTHCALRLKKSGTIVPRVELVEVGPTMDLVVRRHRRPDESLKKEAMKVAPELVKKKEKNVSKDAIAGKIGKIYVPDQQVGSASLPFTPKGVKRERREAKAAKGEDNKHADKKQKQQDDASA
ncbi:hypothetical protein QVD17_00677 [Tagetes erecta]|uniref:Ribosome production factor 2 homolog n=1 Tax=Tagetes erecta TaxID=13708 RepID=A0AAD8LAN3_TARER|nr:hypothetical protein QVD17_00677 [Tagetes erecta]